MKILFVEDDQSTSELLTAALSADRYVVDLATDGENALDFIEQWDYDLILLDWQLPKLDGIQVCQKIREQGNKTPILMLTSRNRDEDVVAGLDAGADDFVTKPCNIKQLLARIRSLLRRKETPPTLILTWDALSLDPTAARVTYHEHEIELRQKEFMLLELLMRNPQRIFSRSDIIDHLWTADNFPTEGAVTNLIKDLRSDLTNAGLPQDIIETKYGIGYRLKTPPEEQSPLPASRQSEEASPQNQSSVSAPAAIEQLRQKHQTLTQQRLLQLETTALSLLKGNLKEEQQQTAKAEAHRLAGNLGMYGYGKASEIARSLEHLLSEDTTTVQNQAVQFMEWFLELQQELNHPPVPAQSSSQPDLLPLVLVISEDDHWAEALQQEARNWSLRLEVIPGMSPVQRKFVRKKPVAISLELGITDSEGDQFDTLREVKQYYPDVPVFTLSAQDDLISRVVASRLGSERYFTKPITAAELLKAIAQRLPQTQPASQARVLIVDDDSTIHPILAQTLQPWGLEVISLMEPEQFWQVLTQTNPDLVLLAIEMPTFNGLELCRVVRQGSQRNDLPILVITAQTDPECIQQVFEAGADDLLRKPIVESELVHRVLHRIERSRLRQQIERLQRQQGQRLCQETEIDALTQVANRRGFDKFLQQSWQQLQWEKAPVSLILCDLDEFKLYNDLFGHPSGDACLQTIASTLQQCVRPGIDQVARYGGEEFALVLPNTPLSGAINVVERIQTAISHLKIPQSATASSPYVSLSLGITGTIPSPDKSIANLIAMADRALYAAKEQGRNTYCLYPL